ncbi:MULTISPECIES: GAF domain-containing protein [unclassified Leptolyngbya]|uniref:GAF domain-containing protein n=1 Tax=unclassified Leptolyngbya TaxID=2650499 RepID=UPI0016877069|nr:MULTISPECIES: GAF domain-containing protein [unclassified Leptolyngbya]MBD1909221.1 GAF domain-containing protein [Leptolyngbya sp. FACHB-8]MBD2153557.1 GAF domain-containing protein [Leptolyngbya sp. FACHB-16]
MPFHHANACLGQVLEQVTNLSRQIYCAAHLDTALAATTHGARGILRSDRLVIYRFLVEGDGVVIAESVGDNWQPIQGQLIYDPCFEAKWNRLYQQGRVHAVEDRETANLVPCYRSLLAQLQVRANLVVPILLPVIDECLLPELWGLLIAHQCESPRQWLPLDTQILQHLAMQLGCKIQSLNSGQPVVLQEGLPQLQTEQIAPMSDAKPVSANLPSHSSFNQIDCHGGEVVSLKAFDFLQNPVWIYDIERSQIHWANQASLHLWNAASRDELLTRDFGQVSESTQVRLQSYLQQFEQGKTLVEQWTFYPGGHPVSVQCRCSGIPIEKGRLAMLVEGTMEMPHQIDQTTLRSLEALRHTSVMISLYTLDGVPLLQNPAALRCYGDTVHPHVSKENAFLHHFVDPMVGVQAMAVLEAEEVFSIETQVLTLEGIRWHGMDARRVNDPITGEVMILVNEKDITAQEVALRDRIQAEANLEAQQAFLHQVIDTVPSSIFVKDKEGRLLVVNQASTEIHGSSVETMLGKREPEFNPNFGWRQLEQFLASNQAIMQSRQTQQHIQQITTANGELRWYQTVIRPWIDANDQVQGVIGNSVDITELKQAEAALQQKSERLATIITVQQDIALNHPNLDAVMDLIVEHAQALTQASGAVIELLEEDALVCRAASGMGVSSLGLRLHVENSLSGCCMTAGKILQCDDVETEPNVNLAVCREAGVRSMVVVPLKVTDGCMGVLKVFSQTPAAFTEQDIQTLQLMAGFLTASIQLATEFESKNALLFALQESEERYRSVVSVMAEGVVLQQADGQIMAYNRSAEKILGLTPEQMMGRTPINPQWQAIYEDGSPFPREKHPATVTLRTGEPQSNVMMGVHKPDGSLTWVSINSQPLSRPDQSHPYAVVTSFADITVQKQAEATLRHQTERERMITAIAQHIRESLNLEAILNTTVTEVRHFLQCDRVIIYRFNPDWSGIVVTESVASGWNSILNMEIRDTYFVENREQVYADRKIQVRDNIYTAGLNQCHIELMERLQVKAKLVVPIWQGQTLWGLLVAHQCNGPRHWQSLERELVVQLATQVAIAIQQSELYGQVQHWNTHLELQVQERTAQLQQALDFEALLKRITDKVRDSLDEQEILRSAVQELAQGLGTVCCDTGIYNADQTTSTIAYESSNHLSSAQGKTFVIANAPNREIYQFLLQGQVCQFCDVASNPLRSDQSLLAVLACPLMDDQGVLGDLWLFKPSSMGFNDQEVRLVQQVANQCAIALRQSRLYYAAQAQVEELARLNQLKDDFLSTVSHELRTPLSGIKMAIEMLEMCLRPLGVFEPETNPINCYFQILQTEYQREIGLINDLLDLTRLDSGADPLTLSPIHLQFWIAHVLEPFVERTHHQEQHLDITIPKDLPPLTTDLAYLERALTELLQNAFKYTPPGENINVSARLVSNHSSDFILIEVSNTGVEIPEVERDRIFEKFYRIPNNDPWKHGGTGLGLSLVKKLVQRLGGAIWVESSQSLTQFIMQLPLTQQAFEAQHDMV